MPLDVPELGAWNVAVQVENIDGQDEIVGLRLAPARRRVGHMRETKINSKMIHAISTKALRMAYGRHRLADLETDWMEVELRRGRAYPPEFYAKVASTYMTAEEANLHPVKLIRDLTGASQEAANKWVRKARELGLLGYPEKLGVSGTTATRSPARRRAKPRR